MYLLIDNTKRQKLLLHIIQHTLHFYLGSSASCNEYKIPTSVNSAFKLGKCRANNAPCTVALNCVADFFRAGDAHTALVALCSGSIGNHVGRSLAFATVIQSAKILVFF